MKRINLTENDIFNIVNKVIAEQSKLTKTPEQLIKRFLYGDNSIRPNIPGIKNRTFTIVEKRGLTKESFQFIVQDVQFITTSKGSSALIKGYVKGFKLDPNTINKIDNDDKYQFNLLDEVKLLIKKILLPGDNNNDNNIENILLSYLEKDSN